MSQTAAIIAQHVADAIRNCPFTASFERREYYLQGYSEYERVRNARGPQVTHELTFAFASGYKHVVRLDADAAQVVTPEMEDAAREVHAREVSGTASALANPAFVYGKAKSWGVTLYAQADGSPSGVESCGAAQNEAVVAFAAGLLGVNAYMGQPFERLNSSAGYQNAPMHA
jgi:hypothetical protein